MMGYQFNIEGLVEVKIMAAALKEYKDKLNRKESHRGSPKYLAKVSRLEDMFRELIPQ